MNIAVCANGVGDGEGSHVSVGVFIIEGKFDDELNWPFVGKVTVELLNQLEDKNHNSTKVELTPENNTNAGGSGRGRPEYIHHSQLSRDSGSNTQYLKDDTVYLLKYQTTSPGWSAQSDPMN